jgi:hypothetical protein
MSGRNNDERTGAKPGTNTDAAAAVQSAVSQPTPQSSGHMNFVVPTEFVELPTGGAYYSSGHPLHGQDTIEIKYMTAKDEDILTSKSLLKKGLAINRFLQNIIVERNIKVEDLLVGDKNAILVAARVSGYGEDYRTKTQCPACATTQEYDFTLSDGTIVGFDTEHFNSEDYADRVTKNDDDTFNIVLPKSEVVLTVRLMNGHDEAKLAEAMNSKKKSNIIGHDTNMTDQYMIYITAVNGSTSMGHIHGFVNVMPASDSRFLRTAYQSLMPNYDLKQHFACESCGYEQDMEVPFTADFFWPKS